MTEPAGDSTSSWIALLGGISRASGHELRNSLNALVVNLEVVRSRAADPGLQQFVEQSVQQSEESVRLAEASIALLDLLIGAIGPDGDIRCRVSPDGGVTIARSAEEVDRTVRNLRALAERGAIRIESSDSAVILTIPDKPVTR